MKRKKSFDEKLFITVSLSPALILFALFMIYPTVTVFRMSLYKWGGYSDSKLFVGLRNFKILIKDERFIDSFKNTIFLITLVTLVTISLALITAAALTRSKIKYKSIFRLIFYIPNILSIIVISSIFSAIYDPSRGLLNTVTSLFTNQPVLWLGDRNIAIYSIGIAMVWQATGYYMVMYMAGMSSVPESLYEAAAMEGATETRMFITITIPMIWENIRTTLTFFIISNINISFLLVRAMTNGGPDGATNVVLNYMYDQAYTNSSYGYGMAIGVVVFIFSFALSFVINKVTKRESVIV